MGKTILSQSQYAKLIKKSRQYVNQEVKAGRLKSKIVAGRRVVIVNDLAVFDELSIC